LVFGPDIGVTLVIGTCFAIGLWIGFGKPNPAAVCLLKIRSTILQLVSVLVVKIKLPFEPTQLTYVKIPADFWKPNLLIFWELCCF
jgi:hypothetical protein